jgi:hypothetical protein
MIANIAPDDALILPHRANPAGLNFRERQPHVRPFAMVDGPMIFEKTYLEIGGHLRRAIQVEVRDQARGMREKICGVEIEDGR